ncbi:MAG: PucR family transcriptional regulator ligand-binding domain-containing protein [Firmicutes bacterium]|nr:PucR family transcriptional regulator ligand-binding domain-containing protein [Bacillota bacterium]
MIDDCCVKVKDIMLLKPFQRAKIIAGEDNGLQRVVKRINVLEVPDIMDWEIKDELLLSQGFSFRDEKKREEMLKVITEKGASGLCVKPKRYLEKVPEDMIDLANKLQFPIVELPFELTFSEIIASVMNMINSNQAEILEQSLKTHKELMNIVLKGGDIGHICIKISDLVNGTVIIEDKYRKPLAYSVKAKSESERKTIEELVQKLYIKNSHTLVNYREVQIPIITELNIFGYIWVFETVKPLTNIDIIAIEDLTTVIALEIMKKETIEEIEKRHINEFLDIIFTKNAKDDQEMIQRGKYYGIDFEKKHNVLLIHFNDNIYKKENISVLEKTQYVQQVQNIIYDIMRFTLLLEGYKGIIGTKAGDFVALIETHKYNNDSLLKKELTELVHKILIKTQNKLKSNVIASISRSYKGIHLPEGYKEAKTALMVMKNNSLNCKVGHFDELGVFKLLHHVPKNDLEIFLKEYIQPLIQYDKKNDSQLIKTLEAYFTFDCNIKDTADYLYVHYNTVVYRLQKIKGILGYNFEEWNKKLNLQLALKMIKLYSVK